MVSTTSDNIEDLRAEKADLERAVEELSVLNDLAQAIGASKDFETVVHTIVSRSVRAVDGEQGMIGLVSEEEGGLMKTLIRTAPGLPRSHPLHFTQSLLGWMQLNLKPLLINDPSHDERFRGVTWEEDVRSILAVPMMIRSRLIAVLAVYNKNDKESFGTEDQRLLTIIASQSAQVVENARLRVQETELLRMQHELQLASAIQQNLLPTEQPSVPGYEIAGRSEQAYGVGGDYFDFIPCSSGRLLICLGDVSGKGLPASLLMSNVQATLRTRSIDNPSPVECLDVANTLLFRSTAVDKYVTLFCALLDPEPGRIEYSNAGHTQPIFISADGTTSSLDERGVMLGLTEKFTFTSSFLDLDSGDMLAIYSDGITESVNSDREEFGRERLALLLKELRAEPAQRIIEKIFSAVLEHTGREQGQDDMTLVVVKRR